MTASNTGRTSRPRTVVLVANRAIASGHAPLDDLPGAGGRFDVVARCVTSALLTSHGVRADTTVVVLFTNTTRGPTALKVEGAGIRGLSPDERSTAAQLNKALAPIAMPVWQDVGPGMQTRRVELALLLEEMVQRQADGEGHGEADGGGRGEDGRDDEGHGDDGDPTPLVLLDAAGDELAGLGLTGGVFVVGDQDGLTDDQAATVRKLADHEASLGPVPLQADQAIVLVHNVLDRA